MLNRTRLTWIIAAIVALALGLACGAGDEQGTTTSGDETAGPAGGTGQAAKAATVQVGQPLTMTREILGSKVVAVITVANVRTVKAKNQFQTPTKGQFLVADVAVAVNEGKFTLTQGSFKVVGADGTVYDTTLPVVEPALGFTELSPGQKTAGAVTFDTAVGAEKGARIALTDLLADGDAGYWQLP
jgi:hypothetical protein